ncbi:MAG: tRNA (adenosine(37)-N6)-threonylcarbamoyltransferase complex dimerization subunit type 1 TsaB [Actinomycetota bacterium]|nr:tRNA (adenosine(37)-N6)-threonylcarbamoyltransferase complex dimerization subunit type 1 TsaB [Actinomycetota bacterium]
MILAFDTATDRLTVALGTADTIIAEINEDAPRAHLSRLLPAIDTLVKTAKIKLSDIDQIAVGIGPGSFTGLRIGLATAQGLAHGLDRPLIGVATLDTIAAALAGQGDTDIYPVLDAKRREVYTAGYDRDGNRLTEYLVFDPKALAENLAALHKPILMAGDGLTAYSSIFTDKPGSGVTLADPSLWPPRASVLIRLAEDKIYKGEVGPYFKVLPIYIRPPDAQETAKREK